MSLLQDLQWRYATKKMNGTSVSDDQLNVILEATQLAATSYGLQPYTVVVVGQQEIKDKLMAAAYGQAQVGSSSHVLVFAVPLQITEADIQAYVDNIAATRHLPVSAMDGYKAMMVNTVGQLPADQQQVWSTKQAYIALGTALAAAASQQVDACPMEGFDAAQFDEILGLAALQLKSVVIMPIGFRAEGDATPHFPKVRKSKEELFHFVK